MKTLQRGKKLKKLTKRFRILLIKFTSDIPLKVALGGNALLIFLNKVLEKIVPSHMRYLTYSCIKENGYFQKIRGRKLAKSNNPVKERGKF